MKEVRKAFIKKIKKNHLDGGGFEEDFRTVFEAKEGDEIYRGKHPSGR